MKFASFKIQTPLGAAERVGVKLGECLLDINAVYGAYLRDERGIFDWRPLADAIQPPDMLSYIRGGQLCLDATKRALDYFDGLGSPAEGEERYLYPVESVTFLAPLPAPVSLRDYSSYIDHISSSRTEFPEVFRRRPPCYRGSTTNCVGSGSEILWYPGSQRMDFELEISAVIGRPGSDIPAENALDYVFGLMIFNDVSARDVQRDEGPLGLGPNKGKNFRGSNIMGPYLTTLDEFDDVQDISFSLKLNDRQVCSGSTRDMGFTIAQLVAYSSANDDLYPGEVIGTGTHGGCAGHETNTWIKPGDRLEITVDNMGVQTAVVGPYIDAVPKPVPSE